LALNKIYFFYQFSLINGVEELAHTANSQPSIEQPLQFDPIFKEKIWGGRMLETILGKNLPFGVNIGESWELSGCGSDQSVSTTADFTGKDLAWLLSTYREKLTGTNGKALSGFPLLYKLIDAHGKLSVQVHPSDADADANGWGAVGKTECWYIVHADPGALIGAGFKNGVSKDDVAAAVRDATLIDLVAFHSIAAGDMVFIPAGTVHTICGNAVIYEVQQTSDITFRLYDWDRLDSTGKSRPLHIRESLQVLKTQWHSSYKIDPLPVETLTNGARTMRIACRYFALEEYRLTSPGSVVLPDRDSFAAVMALDGRVIIAGTHDTVLTKGMSALLPAAMRRAEIRTDSPQAHFLVSWTPDLQRDIFGPLTKLGFNAKTISALGGNRETNDLIPLLTDRQFDFSEAVE
jgi:mannose-6-phosphate isomerase